MKKAGKSKVTDFTPGDCPAVFSPGLSPVAQASMWGVPSPYSWQQAIWAAMWRAGSWTSVVTANESGKSSLVIPVLSLSWAAAFPGSQVIITSASEDQLRLQLWPAIQSMASRNNWTATANQVRAPKIDDDLPESTISLRVTKQGEKFEGFHNRTHWYADGTEVFAPLLIIADEAKSIKREIFLAIDRCNPTCRLYISTSGSDTGDFYDSRMNKGGLWTTGWNWQEDEIDFEIPWTMCPHLMVGRSYEAKKAMLDELGAHDADVQSILLAKFFRTSHFVMFNPADMDAIEFAMSGQIRRVSGDKRGFCDFAAGGDELTFGWRDGNYIQPITAWRNDGTVSPRRTAEKYIRMFRDAGLKPSEISGDNGGLGVLIINELHDLGWPINRSNANQSARYKAGFVDRYTELHWDLKKKLHEGVLILPRDEELLKQMRRRQFVRRNADENRIRAEPKQEARRQRQEASPDRLDTIVALCADMEDFVVKAKDEGGDLATMSIKEYMRRDKADAEHEHEGAFGGGWGGDNFS